MVTLHVYKRKTRFPQYDYMFTKTEDFTSLLEVLTPKFQGTWSIILLDPDIKGAKPLLEDGAVPTFVECSIYMPQNKLDVLSLAKPKEEQVNDSSWDTYMRLIGDTDVDVDISAAKLLFKVCGPDIETLEQALQLLQKYCDNTITVQDVKKHFVSTSRIYARDVLIAFMTRDRHRWYKYQEFEKELGPSYAYNAMYKSIKSMLLAKAQYLKDLEATARYLAKIDAMSIDYAYMLFATSTCYQQLPAILYKLDNRTLDAVQGGLAYVDM